MLAVKINNVVESALKLTEAHCYIISWLAIKLCYLRIRVLTFQILQGYWR